MLLSVLNFVFKWGIILSIVVFLIQYWLVKKSYILSDREVAKIAEKYVGKLIFKSELERGGLNLKTLTNLECSFPPPLAPPPPLPSIHHAGVDPGFLDVECQIC